MSIPSWGRPFRGPNQYVPGPFTGQQKLNLAGAGLALGGAGLEATAGPGGLRKRSARFFAKPRTPCNGLAATTCDTYALRAE